MPVKRQTTRRAKAMVNTQETVMPKAASMTIKEKLKQPKVIVGLVVIVLAIAAYFLKGLFVVALVNGEPITRFRVISELEKQGGEQTLASLVNQALILQEARKKKIEVSKAEMDASVKQIEDSLKKQGQSLDVALKAQGMTIQDLKSQLKLRNLVEKLVADKLKVTDKEIEDYIKTNKDSFPTNMKEDEIKKSVGEQLKQQKLSSASSTWIKELNKNAKINYFINY
jgi:hypothetical protein